MIAVAIPHGAPVRCLAGHAEASPDGLTVRARVPADSPGAEAGWVRPGWLIEVAAQACAACAGAAAAGAARAGLLVGAKAWSWGAAVPAGRELVVSVVRGASLGALAEYRCSILMDGDLAASGSLLVALR